MDDRGEKLIALADEVEASGLSDARNAAHNSIFAARAAHRLIVAASLRAIARKDGT